jgi:DNA-directed RNA polymerase beta subunit
MYAQKQTIGSIVSPEDMPFSEATGMTPDVIVNPHCIPSRMTMGYLMEILASKHGALRGERVNATAFRPFNLDEFRQSLRHYGFNEMGYENMISGITGKRIPCQIFVGPCFLQALKHHVQDKIQARSRGPVKAANRQPARGRARTGGLRFGEMERDAAISHGASQFLRERLCSLSDPHNAILCKTCGAFASSDYTTSQYKCRNCGERGNFGRREVPYAAILLSGILAGMGMHLRLELHSEEELAQQRRARTLQEEEREVMESLQKEVIEAQEAFEEEARELEAEEEGGDVYSVFPEEEGLDE